MAHKDYEILIEQGATFERILTIKDSAGLEIDLTNWIFRGHIRETYSSVSIIESFSFTILDQVLEKGKVKMFISAADTATIPVDPATSVGFKNTKYVYNIEAEKPDGFVYRFLQGLAVVSPDVTRV